MKKPEMRAYNWCLTDFPELQDPERKDLSDELIIVNYILGAPILPDEKLKYAIWCLEKCPETGRLHYHFYCEFTEKVSMKWIKENFENNSLHCEPRLGTQKQAIDYVKKEETKIFSDHPKFMPFYWWGEPKHQGNRSDLDTIVDMIEEGFTGREILMATRGNGLRHINHIYRGLNAFHRTEAIDMLIEGQRNIVDNTEALPS